VRPNWSFVHFVFFFLGGPANDLGSPVTMEEAESRIFGIVLLNDWSARDIQAWEYVPLGPFTAKNFCTSISPWIVTLDALKPFQCNSSAGPVQENPSPLEYIRDPDYHRGAYDLKLLVNIQFLVFYSFSFIRFLLFFSSSPL
jgi:fumarylacetoacetase